MHINLNGELFSLEKPLIMGIVNFTEDSFYDGGRYLSEENLLKRIEQVLHEGADIIDLGAISTRPGALDLDKDTELERIKKALKSILKYFPKALVSVDTWRASVAEMAVGEGAAMINDISGGTFDKEMIPTVGRLHVPYCLMHTTAKPETMQMNTVYESIVSDIIRYFAVQVDLCKEAGINDIILDPGFGFGKTLDQNYLLMENMNAFSIFGLPLLAGISRKSMIYRLLETTPEYALNGTTVLNTISLLKGATILRVHDVKEAKEVICIIDILRKSGRLSFTKNDEYQTPCSC